MRLTTKLMAVAAAFSMTASPVLAAGETRAAPARDAAPVAQSEQLFGGDGAGWLLWVLLGAAAIAGLIVALDDPASP